MKRIIILLLLGLSGVGLQAQTDTTASDSLLNAKIERLLVLSGAEAQFNTAIDQMVEIQKQNPAYSGVLADEFWDEFTEEVHQTGFDKLRPKMVTIYRDNYTVEEIDHQITYFSDPMTQAIVAKQGAVMQQSMRVGAQWGQEISQEIVTRLQEAVEDKN